MNNIYIGLLIDEYINLETNIIYFIFLYLCYYCYYLLIKNYMKNQNPL